MRNENPPLPRTLGVLGDGIARGLHPGFQLFVIRENQIIADVAGGLAAGGAAMTTESITLWMSATKPVTAVALAQLWERNLLQIDDPVARFIPEFSQHAKGAFTLRQLLTHTAGFRLAGSNTSVEPWEAQVAHVCAARPEPSWVPGRTAGYHVAGSWIILGEIVRRIARVDIGSYAREKIFLPLGMTDSWMGIPDQISATCGTRIATMYDTSRGPADLDTPPPSAVELRAVRPGAGGRGPVRELARLYQCLLSGGSLDGQTVLAPQSVAAITARHRVGMKDKTFGTEIDWGLGFLIDSNHYAKPYPYGYGPHAGPRTFGHSGSQSTCAFCDPDAGLVVAWTCNGMPGEQRHQQRQLEINTAVYEDLSRL